MRIGRALLQRNRSLGGLGLPNLLGYYWATNAHKIMLWFTLSRGSWYQIEADTSSSLQAMACSTLPLSPSQYTSKPIVIGTLKIWEQIRRCFRWLTLPQATPICNNHLFLPAAIDPRFTSLERKGIHCLENLYTDNLFTSFDQLRVAFSLGSSDFFRYFQLRNFARTHSPQFPQIPPPTGIDLRGGGDIVLKARTLPEGQISYFYDLLSPADESIINRIRTDWEKELQMTFSENF